MADTYPGASQFIAEGGDTLSACTLADWHCEGEHTSVVAFRDPEQQFLRYAQDFGRRLPLRSRLLNASN